MQKWVMRKTIYRWFKEAVVKALNGDYRFFNPKSTWGFGATYAERPKKFKGIKYKWYSRPNEFCQLIQKAAETFGLRYKWNNCWCMHSISVWIPHRVMVSLPAEIDWRPTETIPEDYYAQ